MSKPTTGKYSVKPYRCNHCGHERSVGTNHWGEIYSSCPNCSWKRPLDATVSTCLEPVPEGYGIPKPWTTVKLGDLVEMTAINQTTRIVPGKAGTVDADELNNVRMGDGKEKPTQVIVGDMLKLYVGIGWVDVRRANQSDADSYPVVVGE